jgi:NAD(P)-dependent dehydrogenase (short-subunit alcohol dehydrogenase family)
MKDFKDKVAFITGGASGLGFGLAKVFSEAGCRIMIADIRKDHIEQALKYFGNKDADVHAVKLDITDRKAFAKAADKTEKIFGKTPELLFNNAGVNAFGPPEASTFSDWDWVINVNLHGVINGMVIFVQRMIKSGNKGHIVSTASFAGLLSNPLVTMYAASKSAVINMMGSYRMALEKYGIGVSVCIPGGINTNIHEAYLTRPKNLKESGFLVEKETVDSLRKTSEASGMDPVDLAKLIKKGIEDNILYIIPTPDLPGSTKRVETYFQEILKAIPDESTVPPEVMKANIEGMAGMKNVGKPRPDLKWVKPMQMPQRGTPDSGEKK